MVLWYLRYAGLSNPEEFSLTSDQETQQEQNVRREGHKERDHKKLDALKKKLHTGDNCKDYWVDVACAYVFE